MSDVVKSHTLRTVREEFDEYLLEDGNTLRIKDVLVAFGFTGEKKKDQSGKELLKTMVQFQQVNGIIPTGNPDTTNLKQQEGPTTDKDRVKKIGFKEKKNTLNLYETDEFLIVIRSRLNEVWTTPFKDQQNIPIYRTNGNSALSTHNKDQLAKFKEKSDISVEFS